MGLTSDRLLQVSKLDAAKRQLQTAIMIYFFEGDPVSIHTLTGAAYNILGDVSRRRGALQMLVKDRLIEDYVQTEHQKLIRYKVNVAENFFKHADRDESDVLFFDPGQSEFLLWDATSPCHELTGESDPPLDSYRIWFIAQYPLQSSCSTQPCTKPTLSPWEERRLSALLCPF